MFRTDRHDDRRVDEAAGLAAGEYEGSTQPAGHTRFRGIAILRANLVDALEVVPKERRTMRWGQAGLGHWSRAKELVDQRAAALGVVEEGGVAPWDDLEARVG